MNTIAIIAIIVILILVIGGGITIFMLSGTGETPAATTPPTEFPTQADILTGEKEDPLKPDAAKDATSLGDYVARTYAFTQGKDATWMGAANEFGTTPFTSVADASRVCDSMSGCRAWVKFGGRAYYRPKLAPTPFTWTTPTDATDGSYIPTPDFPSPFKSRVYKFTQGQDLTYTGKADEIMSTPFVSVAESNRVCDAIPKCRGWVRYKGRAYYRPNIADKPTAWVGNPPEDGSYIPV